MGLARREPAITSSPAPRPAAFPVGIADARGAVRLAVAGIHGVTRIAQGLHGSIAGLAPPLGRRRERPVGGLSGFVYDAVRAGSSVVGSTLDAVLAGLQALPAGAGPAAQESPARRAFLSALNGVVGDYLVRTGNPLAVEMEFVVRGPALPRVLLLVHGLCMDDLGWQRKGHDHGAALAAALGCTPVYVRYNSGRHVSENAAELSDQLDALLGRWPVPVESLAIVGLSMGGLVARSAVRQGRDAGAAWPRHLRKMVFLGTPHEGAALERGGNWLHAVLGASPYLAPFTRLGSVRSDGITDLRHGNLLPGDWQGGRYRHADTRTPVSLPRGVRCYAVAGALGGGGADQSIGDGLVSVDSALGRHPRPSHDLRLPASRTWVARGVHHLDLLSDPGVYARLLRWLR
ncbi:alpha/beta hydrolase [Ramlibacter sp. USB13]|uniref:Alpha/beta hydrolase n=1 Tax=Ramlibacter cellulosilyticus TaxID=2764187 RepID=A0A923MUG7_9BURK|nr:alpha/beta hydrolase [Ramlibacter cellulosilyticus]MBC5784968.1 alpha/beta hydrolase [Ramlibacter cellulosilyticus]